MNRFFRTPYLIAFVLLICSGLCSAQVVVRPIRPSDTDSSITTFDVDSHYVYINSEIEALNALVVHLPGSFGEPKRAKYFGQWAANLGFHSIGLMYPNIPTVGSFCTNSDDPNCFETVRREIVEGIDYSNEVDVLPSESILSRTRALLVFLNQNYPNENWSNFLTDEGQLRYDRIIFSGHSQGGGHAALIAKYYPIARALCFSSPKDWRNATNAPPMWLLPEGWETPAHRVFVFNHVLDEHANQLVIWQTMGLENFGTPMSVDNTDAPYNSTRQLTTDYAVPEGDAHGCTITDNKTPIVDGLPVFGGVWTYMLTYEGSTSLPVHALLHEPSIIVFPNPCRTGQLSLVANRPGVFHICDALGRYWLHHSQLHGPAHIDISTWPSGIYSVLFESGSQRTCTKWIIP